MPLLITDVIVSVHPGADTQGNIIGDTIWVLFDREIDENSIDEGNFIIEGPDTDTFFGPDMGTELPNVSDSGSNDQLASPGYKGLVPGTITFQRINLADLNIYTGPNDTDGTGNLWRTKAIFTPAFPMQALTQYRVYIAGDELPDDPNVTGIRSRTIFDADTTGNAGNGVMSFGGTYTGEVADIYHIEITTAGASGVAWYEWWTDSDLSHKGPVLSSATGSQTLSNGVTVRFQPNNFTLHDIYSATVKPPTQFGDNTYWTFETGTGSIQTLPDSVSTSFSGDPKQLVPTAFSVVSIIPKDTQTNVPLNTRRIVLNFNQPLDPDTITADTVRITGRPVNGDESVLQTRIIYADLTVSGSKLIIDI